MLHKIVFWLVMLCCGPALADTLSHSAAKLSKSKQLIMVTASGWDSATASLQRFEKDIKTHQWKKIGNAIPVVIGKKGMAWGNDITMHSEQEPVKKRRGRTNTYWCVWSGTFVWF